MHAQHTQFQPKDPAYAARVRESFGRQKAMQHIGARLQLRSLASSVSPRRLASQLWRYELGKTTTPEGQDLSTAMRSWVAQTLDTSTN